MQFCRGGVPDDDAQFRLLVLMGLFVPPEVVLSAKRKAMPFMLLCSGLWPVACGLCPNYASCPGRVAQLVRALVSHTRGPGFESLRDHLQQDGGWLKRGLARHNGS